MHHPRLQFVGIQILPQIESPERMRELLLQMLSVSFYLPLQFPICSLK
ncbi:hypothetical protein V6Z12_A09G084200 [Gossypium hirsutum]